MADDLSLLFRLRAQNQASPAIKQVQGDVSRLTKTTSTEFNAMQQVTTSALGRITSSLTNFSSQIPVVGNAVSGLSDELTTMATSTGASGSQFAALAGPIGIAVTVIGALTGAAVLGGKALFDLTVTTADFQGKLFDLGQQVGVSVETLSTLDIIATQTGGSIETVTASLGIFQKTLEAAQDPTSKEAELLAELGITSSDTEVALRQALKALFDLGEGSEQTAKSLELFGRGGRFVNAIMKESGGNIDVLMEKYRDLGILITTDVASASDQFNDDLDTINRQVRALTAEIGNELMPTVLAAIQQIGQFLEQNRGVLANWVTDVEDAIRGVSRFADAIYPLVDAITALVVVLERANLLQGTIGSLIDAAQLLGQNPEIAPLKIPDLAVPIRPSTTLPGSISAPKKSGKSEADASLQLLKQLQTEMLRLEDATKTQIVAAELLDEKYKNINPEIKRQIELLARLIDTKKDQQEVDEQIEAAAKELKQAIDAEVKSLISFIEAQRLTIRGTQSAIDAADEYILRFDNLSGAMDEVIQAHLRFQAILIDSSKHAQQLAEDLARVAEITPPIGGTPPFDGTTVPEPGTVPIDIEGEIGPPPELTIWEEAIGSLQDRMVNFSDFLGGTFIDSLHGVADALAQGIEAWALYGGSFGQAMKQALAALAAKIAAEATLQAALHAAYAIASLAFGDFGSAARHGIAAAKFAAIAGGAALGARALAGGAFDQGGSGSSSGSGNRSTSRNNTQNQNEKLAPIDIPRNAQGQHLTVKIQPPEGWVGQEFRKDYNLNGVTRLTILTDGQS